MMKSAGDNFIKIAVPENAAGKQRKALQAVALRDSMAKKRGNDDDTRTV
jgi:hypothetical protein